MLPGSLVASRFKIERLADSGGMSVVYRALDQITGDPVAIKFVTGTEPKVRERILKEASILESLHHPGIVRYVAHGKMPDDTHFLAMEWIEGETLRGFLRRTRLNMDEALLVVDQVARAMGAAHARGIVHRDLKPNNIFLDRGQLNAVRVIDFGIARAHDANEGLTVPGAVIGTPEYMSPEQARGKAVDARSDVFSLGSILFECLTGRRAFAADTLLAVYAKIIMEEPPRLRELQPSLPAALENLVTRMLAKDRNLRPADGAAVSTELAAFSNGAFSERAHSSRSQRRSNEARSSSITHVEQRLMAVILIDTAGRAPAPSPGATDTVPQGCTNQDNILKDRKASALRFGGNLTMMVGGAVVVTFLGGGAATDLAVQAARCALVLRQQYADAHMSLAMGQGQVSTRWPVGEVIDRAADALRRSPKTPPSHTNSGSASVQLDELAAGLLDARFEVTRNSAGLPVLHAERQPLSAGQRETDGPAPCLGRERELRSLEDLWERTVSEAEPAAALLTGPDGVGKSRVLYELLTRLEARGEPFTLWRVQGDRMRVSTPFAALLPIVLRAIDAVDGEPDQVQQSKLLAHVATYVDPQEVHRVAAFLGEIIGVRFPSAFLPELAAARADRPRMADQRQHAWDTFVAAECRRQPVLLAFDDLQWADQPTLKLIEGTLRSASDLPWMVVGFARPDVHERYPNLWAGRRLHLFPFTELSRKASERIVYSLLGAAAPASTVSRLVERAAGNPLYLKELVRAEKEGKGDQVPGTVLAMLQARLDGMASEDRRVLRAASIFGRTFWSGGVAALLGDTADASEDGLPDAIHAQLARLESKDVILRHHESRFPGHHEYRFQHGLLQEAAYSMLTAEDRALGHRIAGSWLETAGERAAGAIAEHFDRGADPERALGWYQRASEEALAGGDTTAALYWASRGLTAGTESTVRGIW